MAVELGRVDAPLPGEEATPWPPLDFPRLKSNNSIHYPTTSDMVCLKRSRVSQEACFFVYVLGANNWIFLLAAKRQGQVEL